MLKIRMQGTLKDIRWFKGLMERHGEIKVNGVEYTVEDSVKKDRYFNAYLIMGTKDGKP